MQAGSEQPVNANGRECHPGRGKTLIRRTPVNIVPDRSAVQHDPLICGLTIPGEAPLCPACAAASPEPVPLTPWQRLLHDHTCLRGPHYGLNEPVAPLP